MESLSLKSDSLYDAIRKKWVDKTPEETIRQLLLRQMVEQLGYPPSLIAIEKELSQLPHLSLTSPRELPKRRIDILVFAKHGGPLHEGSLSPLLIIECKALPLTPKFAQQVIGYNSFIGAPYLALANGQQILTGSYDREAGIHRFQQGLPSFSTLIKGEMLGVDL